MKEITQYRAPSDLECGMVEMNLKYKKWLLAVIDCPPPLKQIDIPLTRSAKILITSVGNMKISFLSGDCSCKIGDEVVGGFVDSYALGNLVRSPICLKSDIPRCIGLILTKKKLIF